MKKTKLLLSLAMMCLSIAVLCFGVLAATSVTYSISGTISYEVSDVFVKINTSVYGIAEQQSKADVITTVKTMESVSQANSLTINSKTYTRTQTMVEYDSSNATTEPATHTAQTSESKGVEIAYGTYYTYYIVINIQNLSSSKTVDAIITDNTTAELNSIKTTNLYQNNIASTETRNIVIAYSIKDKTQGIDSTVTEINYSLKVSYETTDYTNPIEVINDTTNSYYYVTLGTGYSLDSSNNATTTTTDIKWKLVSLDGISKYTYNSSDAFEARYLSDAVFLQETAVNSALAFNSSNAQNYYNSPIRTSIKDGSYFNITDSSQLSLVKNRKIESINYWKTLDFDSTTGSYEVYDSSKTPLSNSDNSTDKFWLLSCEEVTTFFDNTAASRKWLNSDSTSGVAFWLRSPNSYYSPNVCFVYSDGSLCADVADCSGDYRVRAAFQLV